MKAIFVLLGEKLKDKEKDKHNSTGSISSKSSLSSNSTVGSIGTSNNNSTSATFTINTNSNSTDHKCDPTWVHDMFEGTLTNETRCLCCETVSMARLYFLIKTIQYNTACYLYNKVYLFWYDIFLVPKCFHTSMIMFSFVLDNNFYITKENKNYTGLKIWNQHKFHITT